MQTISHCKTVFILLALAAGLAFAPSAYAAFDSGSTGADGEFAPTSNTTLQIPESGIFNFTTVTIPAGVTVTFTKNSKNTPVTILATGDVTIAGTISLNGGYGSYMFPGVGGAGGFDGGIGGIVNQPGKRGEGPGSGGGGSPRTDQNTQSGGGGGGGFGVNGVAGATYSSGYPAGGAGGTAYGNERILPLIGGSGGGGGGGTNTYVGGAGGGGGGSIVIASSGTINVTGTITATGGNGAAGENNYAGGGGGGSAGSIRLVANTIAGNGAISATAGGGGGSNWTPGGAGGLGRIRVEYTTTTRTAGSNPTMSVGYPYAVVPDNIPTLAITSAGGLNAPAAPKGSFSSPDIMLPFNTQNPITVAVTAANIPTSATVTLKASPTVGTPATATGTLTGTDASSSTSIQITISKTYPSILTASVTFQLASLGIGPIYAQGELVEKMRVEAAMGGGSTITYITTSGKEIPAKQLKS